MSSSVVSTPTSMSMWPPPCTRLARVLGVESFAATPRGYKAMLEWMSAFVTLAKVGVEGTGAYGAGLGRFLHRAGVEVIEVDRPNRQARRTKGKSDPAAVEAARAVLSGRCTGAPTSKDGNVEAIRALLVAKRSAREGRLRAVHQMRHLSYTAPDQLDAAWPPAIHCWHVLRTRVVDRRCDLWRPVRDADALLAAPTKGLRQQGSHFQKFPATSAGFQRSCHRVCSPVMGGRERSQASPLGGSPTPSPSTTSGTGRGPNGPSTLPMTASPAPIRRRRARANNAPVVARGGHRSTNRSPAPRRDTPSGLGGLQV